MLTFLAEFRGEDGWVSCRMTSLVLRVGRVLDSERREALGFGIWKKMACIREWLLPGDDQDNIRVLIFEVEGRNEESGKLDEGSSLVPHVQS